MKKTNLKLIAPHKNKSRRVEDKDIPRIMKLAPIMFSMCNSPLGIHKGGALAIAHSQVESKDPLRFFVTNDAQVIINPEVVRHTGYRKLGLEGCVTFFASKSIYIKRWNTGTIKLSYLDKNDKITSPVEIRVTGQIARVFQHELAHFEGDYIFDDNHYPRFEKAKKKSGDK